MSHLILLRHGESLWNKKNLFTGWVNVPLSPKGVEEALAAGRILAQFSIDTVFCSDLIRSQMTAMLALSAHPSEKTPIIQASEGRLQQWSTIHSSTTAASTIPVYCSSFLNERMYGDLQGLNKEETATKFGAEQVHLWRRSYDVAPPHGESLAQTLDRTVPYFTNTIEPLLQAGQTILISAHGNSLRAIIAHLEKLSESEIIACELATGKPIIYTVENNGYRKAQ